MTLIDPKAEARQMTHLQKRQQLMQAIAKACQELNAHEGGNGFAFEVPGIGPKMQVIYEGVK